MFSFLINHAIEVTEGIIQGCLSAFTFASGLDQGILAPSTPPEEWMMIELLVNGILADLPKQYIFLLTSSTMLLNHVIHDYLEQEDTDDCEALSTSLKAKLYRYSILAYGASMGVLSGMSRYGIFSTDASVTVGATTAENITATCPNSGWHL